MRTTRVAWLLFVASLLGSAAWSQTDVFDDGFESGDLTPGRPRHSRFSHVPPYVDISQIAGLWWPYCDSGDCPWEPPTQLHDGLDFTPNEDLVPFQASAPGEVI